MAGLFEAHRLASCADQLSWCSLTAPRVFRSAAASFRARLPSPAGGHRVAGDLLFSELWQVGLSLATLLLCLCSSLKPPLVLREPFHPTDLSLSMYVLLLAGYVCFFKQGSQSILSGD